MPKLIIKLPLVIKEQEGKESTKVQEVFLNYLISAIHSKYKDGLDGSYRRTFARLQNKFDEAIDKDLKAIEVEQAELDLMKNAFQGGKLPAIFSQNAMLMEDAIENASNEWKTKKV